MRKPAFLTNARLSRLMVSLLLCVGLLLPMMLTFGLDDGIPVALLCVGVLLTALCVVGSAARGGLWLLIFFGSVILVQFVLPGMGLWGVFSEAFKAIILYFNGVTTAAPLFSGQLALLFAAALAILSYAFSSKAAGFLPATLMVVMVFFGMWSLGKPVYLWYTLPALVAVLLMISQCSHEKINLFEVLPMAALVVAAGMLLTPASQVTIPPLYDAAMELKQTISDYLFFTEQRNVFTLGSYGYYPMGDKLLGGAVTPSEAPVMMVKTDSRTLLRAVSRDEYTGRYWLNTTSANRYLYVNPRWATLRESVFQEKLPPAAVQSATTLLDQKALTVQIQNSAASTVFTPVYLRSFSAQNDMVAYFNNSSELFITRNLQSGDRYTVFAPVLEGGSAELGALVNAIPTGNDDAWQSIQSIYLQLPGHMEQKVRDDVNDIVSGSITPYDKACAILRHLKRYYRYDLNPDTPPDNQDFVTYFLYVGREGYCTYYASAMTVLCRMAGLPARYVEGFSAAPASDGIAYVTGRNAHAWTEVYFEGFGWVPFDATPEQEQQSSDPPPESQPPEPTPTPEPPDQQNDTPETQQDPPEPETQDPDPDTDKEPPFPWWWLLLAAALCAGLYGWVRMRMPDAAAKKQQTEQDRIFIYGAASSVLLRQRKLSPKNGETPLAFAHRIDQSQALPTPIAPLWEMMTLSRYSRRNFTQTDTARARRIFDELYKQSQPLDKLRFMLTIAFHRDCYAALETRLTHQTPQKQYTLSVKSSEKAARENKEAFRRPKNGDDDSWRGGGDAGGSAPADGAASQSPLSDSDVFPADEPWNETAGSPVAYEDARSWTADGEQNGGEWFAPIEGDRTYADEDTAPAQTSGNCWPEPEAPWETDIEQSPNLPPSLPLSDADTSWQAFSTTSEGTEPNEAYPPTIPQAQAPVSSPRRRRTNRS